MTLSRREKQQRTREVLALRKQGCSNQEIIQITGKSIGTITHIVGQLLANGKIEDQRKYNQGSSAGKIDWEDLESESTKTLIEMVKRHATCEQMGSIFGLTAERVRQVVKLVVREHGEDIFEQDESFLKLEDVIDFLELPKDFYTKNRIRNICANNKIICRRRSDARRSCWLIKESELEKLKQLLLAGGDECKCVICQTPFLLKKWQNCRRKTCSEECYKEYNRQLHNSYIGRKPTLNSLGGWHKDLWQKLQTHILPENEQWLSRSEAMSKTGLTSMQLHWLRSRNIVTIRRHLTKKWRGRPIALYAASEMDIAAKVFRDWQAKKGESK